MSADLLMFYDTETTGLPLFREPSDDPRQPHIVEFAAALVDRDTRETVETLHFLVKPDGWVVPEEATAIHGITTERALDEGIPAVQAVDYLFDFWAQSVERIAHNESFDARMVRIALKRHSTEANVEAWEAGKASCTANMTKPLCKLPPTGKMRTAGNLSFKNPKLSEAHRILLGAELYDAHSAIADMEGCRRVYFAAVDMIGTMGAS